MKLKSTAIFGGFILLLSGCTSAEVDMVKNGSLSSCPNHTLEEMVDGFFGSPSWNSGTSDDGIKFVNVSGDMAFSGKEVTGMLQFIISDNNETFQYRAFEINEIPQNNLMAGALLKKMCASATSSSGVISDYKKAAIRSNIESGIKNIALGEEAYFADGARKYTDDFSELSSTGLSFDNLLEIANVNIELTRDVYVITAQSKEVPSITMSYDGDKGVFVSN